ncbi:MAG: HEAT repeat domain-containing protein [Planctomycetota bacterium]
MGALLAGRDVMTGEDAGRAGTSRERRRAEILSGVRQVLSEGGDIALIRESLLALAAAGGGDTATGSGLDHYARFFLAGGHPELQEAAAIALGVEGEAASVPLLRALLDNAEDGWKLANAPAVPVRLRAFAAFALGLIGERTANQELRLSVVHSLLAALGNERTATREIQVACVLAAGLVDLEFCDTDPARLARHKMEGDRHLCGGILLRYLLDVFRDHELDPWVRAHAAPAMGRLGRSAPLDFRRAVLEELGGALASRSGEPDFVRQGAVLGLGLFADGDDEEIDAAARFALTSTLKQGDPLSQRFALIALARAVARPGGSAGTERSLVAAEKLLLGELARGRKDRRSWAALALGVLGHARIAARAPIPADIAAALRHSLGRAKGPPEAAAAALGLGILRDPAAAETILAAFERIEDPLFRACAALALGLVQAREGAAVVRAAFLGEECDVRALRPDVALGLRLLGDREATGAALARLKASEDPAERAALAGFLAALADPGAAGPLLALATDPAEKAPVRAAAIRGLGRLADPRTLPWSAAYAVDLQYELLTWTLASPFGDGTGLLDWR